MSAYCPPGYTVSVINSKNQIIREMNEHHVRTAPLDFGDEYKLRIKNKSPRRAYAEVKIDGLEVSPGRRFILQAGQTLDLERFILDGDLDKGRRFKFISLEEGIREGTIQDPTSPDNGVITVLFYPESATINWLNNPIFRGCCNHGSCGCGGWHSHGSSPFIYGVNGTGAGGMPLSSVTTVQNFMNHCVIDPIGGSSVMCSTNGEGGSLSSNTAFAAVGGTAGATVEGSESTQRFHNASDSFATDSPVMITIQLKGKVQPKPQVSLVWSVNQKGEVLYKGEKLPIEGYRVTPEGLQIHVRYFDYTA